jgi:thiol-disulfide isomerase/thioredoxin
MKQALIIAAIAASLALFFVGLKDIKKFGQQTSQAAVTSDGKGEGGSVADPGAPNTEITTIKFVKNPTPAPQFTVKDLDGNTLSPADWKGKVVLLNFWATWCGPCRAEIPDLIKLQKKYEGRLQIVGLSDDTGSPQTVKDFVKQNGMNYPIGFASPELEAKFGGVMGLPTSFLIDTDGRVVQKHIGLRNPDLYDLEIRALLKMPVKAKVETFEDNGQVLLTNAKNATELPGVDMSKLNEEQKRAVLKRLNTDSCSCGCGLTLAQCRINDSSCDISEKRANELVKQIAKGAVTASNSARP